MTMGQRIRQARIEAGLSQRQLAGDAMTRNMLSALEHDGANPSVTTLKYLSEKLCKPIGYFFGEEIPEIPEAAEMEEIRRCFRTGDHAGCMERMKELEQTAFAAERNLLEVLCLLEQAKKAITEGRMPYGRELLRQCERALGQCPYLQEELRRKWLILSAQAAGKKDRPRLVAEIPPEDDVLLLRAQGAADNGEYEKAGRLLDAAEDRSSGKWNCLRGDIYLFQQEYAKAAECYHKAEGEYPEKIAEKLEISYREMGDYKMAYFYAKSGKHGQ